MLQWSGVIGVWCWIQALIRVNVFTPYDRKLCIHLRFTVTIMARKGPPRKSNIPSGGLLWLTKGSKPEIQQMQGYMVKARKKLVYKTGLVLHCFPSRNLYSPSVCTGECPHLLLQPSSTQSARFMPTRFRINIGLLEGSQSAGRE